MQGLSYDEPSDESGAICGFRPGLVTRAPEGDGSRAVTVTLTPAGHDLIERLVDRVLGREAQLISGLNADERDALTETLRDLLHHLESQLGRRHPTQVGSDYLSD